MFVLKDLFEEVESIVSLATLTIFEIHDVCITCHFLN
jgi:hypothetical protein